MALSRCEIILASMGYFCWSRSRKIGRVYGIKNLRESYKRIIIQNQNQEHLLHVGGMTEGREAESWILLLSRMQRCRRGTDQIPNKFPVLVAIGVRE